MGLTYVKNKLYEIYVCSGLSKSKRVMKGPRMLRRLLKRLRRSHISKSASFLQQQGLSKELIENIINKFEEWRVSYNNEQVGYGIDTFLRTQKMHYPMAYAIFIRAFIEMYRYTNDTLWLEKAINAAKFLERIKIKENLYAWGLPFSWEGRVREPYAITTAFVGHAYLDLYEQTHDENYLAVVKKIADWVINELGFAEKGEGICFWYSPNDKEEILNSSAEIIAVLGRYMNMFSVDDERLINLVKHGYNYIKSRQLPTKDWIYSGEAPYSVFNNKDFHVGYIIESNYYLIKNNLIPVYQASEDVVQPYISVIRSLMNDNGSLNKSDLNNSYESTLMGYGALIYSGLLALEFTNEREAELITEYICQILNYVLSNLYSSEEGCFYYRCDNHETRYIRDEAHIFYALTKLLNSSKFWQKLTKLEI